MMTIKHIRGGLRVRPGREGSGQAADQCSELRTPQHIIINIVIAIVIIIIIIIIIISSSSTQLLLSNDYYCYSRGRRPDSRPCMRMTSARSGTARYGMLRPGTVWYGMCVDALDDARLFNLRKV